MGYSYGQLDQLIENAKREAMIADLTCNEWDYDGTHLTYSSWYTDATTEYGGGGAHTWKATFDLDGNCIDQGGARDSDISACKNSILSFKQKWDTNIETVIYGWTSTSLPKPSDFGPLVTCCEKAIKELSAPDEGSQHSPLGETRLEDISNMQDLWPSERSATGATLTAFYVKYGPNRLRTVFHSHCEAVGALYVALTGEQEVWEKSSEDIANLMGNAVEAFKQTRQNHATEWKSLLTVGSAAAGLAATFATGPVGAFIGGLAASGSFLGTVMGELDKSKSDKPLDYSGSSPDKVYSDLTTAVQELSTTIKDKELGFQRMLSKMLHLVEAPDNRENFHINPKKGLDPSFAHSDDIIDMSIPLMQRVGYTMMPKIASCLYEASDDADAANDSYPWCRVGTIGMGVLGPYDDWKNLLYAIYPLMDSSGAEIVKAGEHLAEAAGYMQAADDEGARAMGKHSKEVAKSSLGWTPPHQDPPPPPPRRGGPQPTF